MSELELDLRAQLHAKTREIEMFVAKVLGLGDINALDALTMRRHEENVRRMIEQHEESLRTEQRKEGAVEGDPVKERQGVSGLLAKTEIGRLLQEQ